ncbi:MAG: hypothetical protein JW765_03240 [Deltaproteobacteria bacterium]|nr:hypothetical protein [Candidatus Zymogenaceae bacterium]
MKNYSRVLSAAMIIGLSIVLISGCVRVPPPVPPKTLCASFVGTWNTDAGPVEITQDECYATGIFPSPLKFQTIRGAVRGSRFEFDWEGPLGTGRGVVTINSAGDSFTGTYGYGNSISGGTFSATRGVWPGTE